ncbi:MAG: hypothetical protein JO256_05405 [Alphaproteobacteria bacterium]|nr:hypothetical protein [Alphaproteobacteria bacterium]
MPTRPPIFQPRGKSAADRIRDYDRERGSAAERLYDWRWGKAAKAFLALYPLCRYCALHDRVTVATVVDHFWPHRGDRVLFWRSEFWVPACDSCHSGLKQAVERKGMAALRGLAARLGLAEP